MLNFYPGGTHRHLLRQSIIHHHRLASKPAETASYKPKEAPGEVLAAHDAAVAAAVAYLEREAARTRRGAGGTERVEVDGLVAAAFGHRTSRAGDPLLHTHVLVANLARTADDGKWRTLESRRIYMYAKTAGFLYQAQLRRELTDRLGVAWGPVTNGDADIEGVDRELIESFSTRRRQILDRLDERGESSARAAQVATLETRTPKGQQPTELELRARWAEQALELGFDPRQIVDLVGDHRTREPDLDGLVRELVDQEGLTEHVSTFARRDLLQAIAGRLPDGATVAEVEALADAVVEAGREQLVQLSGRRGRLSAVDAIRTKDGRIVAGDEVEPLMTTRGLLLAEQHAINTAVTRQREGAAVVNPKTVEAVLAARPSMTGEQAVMLRRLTGDGDGVAVVVGRAGTGKTCYITPRIGGVRLEQLTPEHLDKLYRSLEANGKRRGPCRTDGRTCPIGDCSPDLHDGLAAKSVRNVHGCIHVALEAAVQRGYVPRNVADLANPPRAKRARSRNARDKCWTRDQLVAFLDHCRDIDDPLDLPRLCASAHRRGIPTHQRPHARAPTCPRHTHPSR